MLVGDLNSRSDGTGVTYNDVLAARFTDAAVLAGLGGIPTCCQADDLLNPVATADLTIDFVLFRGDFGVLGAEIIGYDPADRTPSGFWAADHAAGVVGRLQLPHP